MEPVFRQTGRPAAPGPTWGGVLVAVLFGTVVAAVVLLPVLYLLSLVDLLPGDGITSEMSSGPGWPWPIHGWWPALADAGPMAGAASAMAVLVRSEVRRRTAGDMLLVPVIATAIGVGWLPVPRPQGLLDVPFPLAFAAILLVVRVCWIRLPLVPPTLATTTRTVRHPRRRRPAAMLVRVAAGCVALVAASISYHVLNPIRIETERTDARSGPRLSIINDGPSLVRLLSVRPPDARGRALVRVEVPSRRTLAATMAELLRASADNGLAAGDSRPATATIAPRNCAPRLAVTLTMLDVRLRTRWATRTQRIRLASPLRVTCRGRA
jgi:hypothetical protein